ncbi:MAG: hypothetical protein OEW15_13235 [Nitrospirota bacterium]|nr:hypothetical protein [Nitrospirota bacterium]
MRTVIISLACLSAIGCATTLPVVNKEEINKQMTLVNVSDGVNRDEALILARNYMVNTGYDYDWNVNKPKTIEDAGDYWAITFPPLEDGWGSGRRKQSEITFQHLLPYFVHVTKADGSISVTKVEIKNK